MSASKFNPKLSEAQQLFEATLIEPRALTGTPKIIGETRIGEKRGDGSTDCGASIDYFGEPASPSRGTPGELKTIKLDWNTSPNTNPKALPHKLRKLTTKPEQKGWVRTTSEDSVTVRLGGLSITGLFGAETDPSIRVEGSVDAVATHKRVIEKLIEHTIIDDKIVPSPGIVRRYDRSEEAAKPVSLSYGERLIGYVERVSNYQPGQNLSELISGVQAAAHEPEQILRDVA